MENTIPITPITSQPITPVTPITPTPKKDGKWLMWGLIGFTLILLATAVILFFQLKKPAAPAPKPKPKASPQTVPVQQQQTEGICTLSFTVGASPSPNLSACFGTCDPDIPSCANGLTCIQEHCVNSVCPEDTDCTCASPVPSASPSPNPSASPSLNVCFDTCDNDSQCMSGLRCMTVSSQKRCVNTACTEDTDCTCASPVPSASPQASASPIAAASVQPAASPRLLAAASPAPAALPKAGGNAPLVLGVSAGILMMLLGLLF